MVQLLLHRRETTVPTSGFHRHALPRRTCRWLLVQEQCWHGRCHLAGRWVEVPPGAGLGVLEIGEGITGRGCGVRWWSLNRFIHRIPLLHHHQLPLGKQRNHPPSLDGAPERNLRQRKHTKNSCPSSSLSHVEGCHPPHTSSRFSSSFSFHPTLSF